MVEKMYSLGVDVTSEAFAIECVTALEETCCTNVSWSYDGAGGGAFPSVYATVPECVLEDVKSLFLDRWGWNECDIEGIEIYFA